MSGEEWVELGRAIRARRTRLGLSVSAAAREAGLDRGTWTAVENATRQAEQHTYGVIERVLHWQPGSIYEILEGGHAVPVEEVETTAKVFTTPEVSARLRLSDEDRRRLQAEIDRIERMPIDASAKLEMFGALMRVWEQYAQEQAGETGQAAG